MKPLLLYRHPKTPNPAKPLIILNELSLPYVTKSVGFDTLKQAPYTDVNPNGRVPALEDPNTGITLWESNAIVFYLVETYDKERRLTYDTVPEKFLLQQWSYFQASGQGPYFGQAAWFQHFHPEPLESAKKRYANEIKRVTGVLDSVLKNRSYLVGDKLTWADLVFVPYNRIAGGLAAIEGFDADDYPNWKRWQEGMLERESVKRVVATLDDEEISSEGGK